jgi:hypothetical protein
MKTLLSSLFVGTLVVGAWLTGYEMTPAHMSRPAVSVTAKTTGWVESVYECDGLVCGYVK